MIDFLIKSSVCLFLLLSIYKLFLEQEKMSVFNRFYLLGSLIFSMMIPFISFEIQIEAIKTVNLNAIEIFPSSPVIAEKQTNYLPISLWSIYGIITSIFAFRFFRNCYVFFRKINSNPTQKFEGTTLILVEGKILSHTFMNYIFINKNDYENRKIEGELFTHELTHVRQKHTLDVLFIEILKTIFWFNPLLIFYKKAIQLNHEFLADEKVVISYNNVPFYQSLLLEKASWNSNFYLASNLNFLVTKKRLIMMTKTTSKNTSYFKKIVIIPFMAGIIYFNCIDVIAQEKVNPNEYSKTTKDNNAIEKRRSSYFSGVRFIVYNKAIKTKSGMTGEDIVFDKTYKEFTQEDKERWKAWLATDDGFKKNSPTQKELEDFKNASKYAIWIDGKNVKNTELNNYKPSEIAYFSGSSVFKNARTKQHPQPFQYWFYSQDYFDKNEMGKEIEKYPSDKKEIFISNVNEKTKKSDAN